MKIKETVPRDLITNLKGLNPTTWRESSNQAKVIIANPPVEISEFLIDKEVYRSLEDYCKKT